LNIALLESKPFKARHPIDAHDRTSRIISEELGWDLVYTGHHLRADKPYLITGGRPHYYKYLKKEYDAIIIVYYVSYGDIEALKHFVQKNKNAKLFWLSNEYGNVPNYNFLFEDKRQFTVIAIYSELPKELRWKYGKKIDGLHCVNLNALIANESNELSEKRYGIVYYGGYRLGRIEYFEKYLHGGIWLSTSTKNFKKFSKHINFCDDIIHDWNKMQTENMFQCECCPKKIKKLRWVEGQETLNSFRYNLYLQDGFSHDFPEHIAQRFYEAWNCNNVLLFDANCKGFFQNHGKQIDDIYFVDSHRHMMDKVRAMDYDFLWHLEKQKEWHKDNLREKENALCRIKEIVENSIS